MKEGTTAKRYNLRNRSGKIAATSAPVDGKMTNLVFSPEQFKQFLEGITSSLKESRPTPSAGYSGDDSNATTGNFSECKSRFSAAKGESVDAFIDAITVYKDCVNISEENAPMLLDGAAATWWQGSKASLRSWQKAVEALRRSFGEQKPNYRIFRELFSTEQREREPTDVFVSHARALLSKLSATPVLDDIHRIDMVYGLLHQSIRKAVPRDQVGTFEQLISKVRQIEDVNNESRGGRFGG
ncbi:hypothetical protein Zmor_003834 [Zophobas morio]|uniref:Uncharacterized protein n=1 Tax=Zophobas morio TaxID=2755281 RepID=A0AA38HP76_9CUCU|nr:hypothetical protein Zmor_003834 [Zophobas morio]